MFETFDAKPSFSVDLFWKVKKKDDKSLTLSINHWVNSMGGKKFIF